jgi:PRTRC genetic system protein B
MEVTMATTRPTRHAKARPASSPYQRALPPELDVEEDPLRLRLDFHDESVILHDYGDRGAVTTRLVAALDVAHALASELDLTTGLLPPDALWVVKRASGVWLALWEPPRVRTVRLRTSLEAPPRRYRLPCSGLVFLCPPAGQAPYVFAAKDRPRREADNLYHAPFYNVFASGRVCVGTHPFPRDPARVPHAFFTSYFSAAMDTARDKSQRHPDDIGHLWDELDMVREFPLDDLVAQITVGDAMRLGATRGHP